MRFTGFHDAPSRHNSDQSAISPTAAMSRDFWTGLACPPDRESAAWAESMSIHAPKNWPARLAGTCAGIALHVHDISSPSTGLLLAPQPFFTEWVAHVCDHLVQRAG